MRMLIYFAKSLFSLLLRLSQIGWIRNFAGRLGTEICSFYQGPFITGAEFVDG